MQAPGELTGLGAVSLATCRQFLYSPYILAHVIIGTQPETDSEPADQESQEFSGWPDVKGVSGYCVFGLSESRDTH